jgi:methionine transaminase
MSQHQYYLELAQFYQHKRDLFVDRMKSSRFTSLPCAGTYFQMMDYSAINNERDVDFARRLTTQHGVAAIPPSVFYHNHKEFTVVRFCFAKEDQTLTEAAERLCRINSL